MKLSFEKSRGRIQNCKLNYPDENRDLNLVLKALDNYILRNLLSSRFFFIFNGINLKIIIMKKTVKEISASKQNEVKEKIKFEVKGGAAHIDYSTQWHQQN